MPSLASNFLTLVCVIAFARSIGYLFRRMGQPRVMGEVLGGIILGPSLMGYFYPVTSAYLFNKDSLLFLKHIAELGIVLYLFVMGLEIDLPRLKKSARSALVISQLSIVLPFALGLLLAHQIYFDYAPAGFGKWEFSLFIAISLSITAFPVLARILSDSPLHKTKLGDLALTCAAIDDVTAWCLLAVITGVAASSVGSAWITTGLAAAYVMAMVAIARPLVGRLIERLDSRYEEMPDFMWVLALLGALASATITELIGIHALFGAFLFGAIIPHDSRVAERIGERLNGFVGILFLPAFFALTGLKTQISLISGTAAWSLCAVIIGLAILGKFGGAFMGAIITGKTRHEGVVLGLLMNTRGLMELIVLNIGLSIGIITPTLFAMLVIMALVTTFMAGPLLKLVRAGVPRKAEALQVLEEESEKSLGI